MARRAIRGPRPNASRATQHMERDSLSSWALSQCCAVEMRSRDAVGRSLTSPRTGIRWECKATKEPVPCIRRWAVKHSPSTLGMRETGCASVHQVESGDGCAKQRIRPSAPPVARPSPKTFVAGASPTASGLASRPPIKLKAQLAGFRSHGKFGLLVQYLTGYPGERERAVRFEYEVGPAPGHLSRGIPKWGVFDHCLVMALICANGAAVRWMLSGR